MLQGRGASDLARKLPGGQLGFLWNLPGSARPIPTYKEPNSLLASVSAAEFAS